MFCSHSLSIIKRTHYAHVCIAFVNGGVNARHLHVHLPKLLEGVLNRAQLVPNITNLIPLVSLGSALLHTIIEEALRLIQSR